MKKLTKGGLPCFQFHLIEGFSGELDHAVFTRSGGVSPAPWNSLNVRFGLGDGRENVIENRRRVLKALNLRYCVSAYQSHGRNVLTVDAAMKEKLFSPGQKTVEIEDTDGLVTNQPGVGLMVQVADCQAILLFDPGRKILGMAHAGWRGLKQDVSGAVIEEMVKLGSNPAHLLVGISPSLGPAHSQFSDPAVELGPDFMPFVKNNRLDMWEYSRRQLIGHGVAPGKIEIARIDTADPVDGSRFYSFRREKGQTGRFAMVAIIR